ncbi:MAG: SDR family NAD(P)-dependent oxidoreductase [Deltaproteobacteria bacterium]|nr:SDR family NAD(P)-dependent oxidoreductase [Deltaproteobacteria bacterium]
MLQAGQRAVVTGASSGLGRALALALAKRGLVIHAFSRRPAELAVLAAEVGPQLVPVEVDLLDEGQARTICAAIPGPIDLLVHGAGMVELGPVAQAPVADLDAQYQLNLRVPFWLTQLFLPQLIARQGQVVFLNSGAGLTARGGWSQYAMTKFGLKALADALREEVKPLGVRVMSVYPGRAATPMQERVRRLEGQPYRAEDYLQPEDVGHLVVEALALPRTADVIDLNIRPGRA